MIRNTSALYETTRQCADWLKKPFHNWTFNDHPILFAIDIIFKVPIMVLGLFISLPFRQISIWTHPGVVQTTTEAESKEVADVVTVLSYNIFGMQNFHAAKDKIKTLDERVDAIFALIEEADADVVMLQEVHIGTALERKITERFEGTYKTLYMDMGAKTFFFGSGLMILTKFTDTECTFHPFEARAEPVSKKGFAVLDIKNAEGNTELRITDTHLTAGMGKETVRAHEVQQILNETDTTPEIPFFFGGDFNIDRLGSDGEYTKTHPMHHDQAYLIDGFDKTTRAEPTFRGTRGDLLAFDTILGVHAEGKWSMSTEIRGVFKPQERPSDHAALLTTLTRQI